MKVNLSTTCFVQINLAFLLNIVRILVSKLQANSTPEVDQVR